MPLLRDARRPRSRHVALASTASTLALGVAFATAAGAGACSSGDSSSLDGMPPGSGGPGGDGGGSLLDGAAADSGTPFTPDGPYTYVAKVKNILIGLPPTDLEVTTVASAADPQGALAKLVQGWMTVLDPNDPEGRTYYAEKMLAFFMQATQQTQISINDFGDQVTPSQLDIGKTAPLLLQNAIESFARTMIDELVNHAQPTTNVVTTKTFMMTTALMETYAFLDTWQVNDSGKVVDQLAAAYPTTNLTIGSATVKLSDSIDDTKPATFMHFTDPDVKAGGPWSQIVNNPAACVTDPVSFPLNGVALHYLLYGHIQTHREGTALCPQYGGTAAAGIIGNAAAGGASDFTDWRPVTIRQPGPGEATTTFYDVASLRGSSSLVLDLPRVGFFTTPAFFANWQTNTSNTMRVTTNQMLIVALGSMYDGADLTTTPMTSTGTIPGLDPVHDTGPCFSCHRLLDPGRSLLASTYSWNYHAQDDAGLAAEPGIFAFQNVTAYPKTVFDLAGTLSTHPLFAQAWVQKLCYYVNSQACETDDMEFGRIVKDFGNGQYSWNDLVTELVTSPLTTNAVPTQTTADSTVVAVSRLGHFCSALDFRLGFQDVCGLLPTTTPVSSAIVQIARGLPSDGYGRGSKAPVLPNLPSLFYRAGTENICQAVAQLVVDPTDPIPGVTTWSSKGGAGDGGSGDGGDGGVSSVDKAITAFVETIMAIVPSDPRHDPLVSLLHDHYEAALGAVDPVTDASDFKPTTALQSTFVAACLAPSSVGMGM